MGIARSRWAAIGAALAVSLGAGGGFRIASATIGSGERAVFVPITPCRLMDTRPAPDNVGPRVAPLGPGDTYSVNVLGDSGQCSLPGDATGVVLNVTVVGPTAPSYLTVFPAGPRPLASNLNYAAGQAPTPNAVTVDVPKSGEVSFFNAAGSVDVIADAVGYYANHNHDDRYQRDLGQLVIGAESFVPAFDNESYLNYGWGLNAESGSPCFLAPAALPQGAVVTSLRARVADNVAGDTTVDFDLSSLETFSVDSIAFVETSGASTEIRTFVKDVADAPPVDLTQNRYFVEACVAAPNVLFEVIIEYTP